MPHKLEAQLRALISEHFDGDNGRASEVLTRVRGKKTSVRTIQAWLAPDGNPSKRRCPPEAVDALSEFLSGSAPQDATGRGQGGPLTRRGAIKVPDEWRRGTSRSGAAISEAALREIWESVPAAKLPTWLFELERSMVARAESTERLLHLVLEAIVQCRSVEELREKVDGFRVSAPGS